MHTYKSYKQILELRPSGLNLSGSADFTLLSFNTTISKGKVEVVCARYIKIAVASLSAGFGDIGITLPVTQG
jgi:hypothetical protein